MSPGDSTDQKVREGATRRVRGARRSQWGRCGGRGAHRWGLRLSTFEDTLTQSGPELGEGEESAAEPPAGSAAALRVTAWVGGAGGWGGGCSGQRWGWDHQGEVREWGEGVGFWLRFEGRAGMGA